MEGSIIVGKSGSKVINLDTVQCGVAKDKNNVLSFFARAVKKVKERMENSITPEPIKVHNNIVTEKDGEVNRLLVKDKKAKSISKSKLDKDKLGRIRAKINEKYGHTKDSTPNR
ncbi:MAG: hypothetical protein IKE91_08495 [Clostridia bacterium]|nr:hypothetical protein [Clostridia bacterium]